MREERVMTVAVRETNSSIKFETAKMTNKVICNNCGEVLWDAETATEKGKAPDFVSFSKTWGHLSNHYGETHSLHLCERCYETLVSGLLKPVSIERDSRKD